MEADLFACQVVKTSQQVLLDFIERLLQAFKLICSTLHSTDMCEIESRLDNKTAADWHEAPVAPAISSQLCRDWTCS